MPYGGGGAPGQMKNRPQQASGGGPGSGKKGTAYQFSDKEKQAMVYFDNNVVVKAQREGIPLTKAAEMLGVAVPPEAGKILGYGSAQSGTRPATMKNRPQQASGGGPGSGRPYVPPKTGAGGYIAPLAYAKGPDGKPVHGSTAEDGSVWNATTGAWVQAKDNVAPTGLRAEGLPGIKPMSITKEMGQSLVDGWKPTPVPVAQPTPKPQAPPVTASVSWPGSGRKTPPVLTMPPPPKPTTPTIPKPPAALPPPTVPTAPKEPMAGAQPQVANPAIPKQNIENPIANAAAVSDGMNARYKANPVTTEQIVQQGAKLQQAQDPAVSAIRGVMQRDINLQPTAITPTAVNQQTQQLEQGADPMLAKLRAAATTDLDRTEAMPGLRPEDLRKYAGDLGADFNPMYEQAQQDYQDEQKLLRDQMASIPGVSGAMNAQLLDSMRRYGMNVANLRSQNQLSMLDRARTDTLANQQLSENRRGQAISTGQWAQGQRTGYQDMSNRLLTAANDQALRQRDTALGLGQYLQGENTRTQDTARGVLEGNAALQEGRFQAGLGSTERGIDRQVSATQRLQDMVNADIQGEKGRAYESGEKRAEREFQASTLAGQRAHEQSQLNQQGRAALTGSLIQNFLPRILDTVMPQQPSQTDQMNQQMMQLLLAQMGGLTGGNQGGAGGTKSEEDDFLSLLMDSVGEDGLAELLQSIGAGV